MQPLQLPWELRLNADQFELVCQANPDAVFELTADGQLIAMTPTGSETGARNGALERPHPSASPTQKPWRAANCSRAWRWIWPRSGSFEQGRLQSEQGLLHATAISKWERLPDWNPKLAATLSRVLR
jgi:hypothetical protein